MADARLVAGLALLAGLAAAVALGPWLWPLDPTFIDPDPVRMLAARNLPGSAAHPLGTDQLGRDLLARLLQGGRISLAVGLSAMVLAVTLGTAIGVLAGWVRGLDGLLMRLTDAWLSLPLLPLLLVLLMLFRDAASRALGPEAGPFILIVAALGLTAWMPVARLARAEVLSLRERDFIRAAQGIGARGPRIIRHHLLPNLAAPILVAATLCVAEAILLESVLSFLGQGFPPDFPTWGSLLHEGLDDIRSHPGRVLWPGLAITLTVLAVNLLGEGLRRQLDPRLRDL